MNDRLHTFRGSASRRFPPPIPKNMEAAIHSAMEALERELRCPVCLEMLDDPHVLADKCKHVFCKSCVARTLESVDYCPLCRARASNRMVYPDPFMAQLARSVSSACAALRDGGTLTVPFPLPTSWRVLGQTVTPTTQYSSRSAQPMRMQEILDLEQNVRANASALAQINAQLAAACTPAAAPAPAPAAGALGAAELGLAGQHVTSTPVDQQGVPEMAEAKDSAAQDGTGCMHEKGGGGGGGRGAGRSEDGPVQDDANAASLAAAPLDAAAEGSEAATDAAEHDKKHARPTNNGGAGPGVLAPQARSRRTTAGDAALARRLQEAEHTEGRRQPGLGTRTRARDAPSGESSDAHMHQSGGYVGDSPTGAPTGRDRRDHAPSDEDADKRLTASVDARGHALHTPLAQEDLDPAAAPAKPSAVALGKRRKKK